MPARTHPAADKGPRSTLRPLRLIQTALLVAIGVLCLAVSIRGQQPKAAVDVVRSWNEAVATIEPENEMFRELFDSYKRNPPARVVLAPDVRAAQKKRRLSLIAGIIDIHEERIRAMRRLAKAEEASQ